MIWIFSSMPPAFALSFSASSLVTVFLNSDVAWGGSGHSFTGWGSLLKQDKVLVLSMPQEHFVGMGDPGSSLVARRCVNIHTELLTKNIKSSLFGITAESDRRRITSEDCTRQTPLALSSEWSVLPALACESQNNLPNNSPSSPPVSCVNRKQ